MCGCNRAMQCRIPEHYFFLLTDLEKVHVSLRPHETQTPPVAVAAPNMLTRVGPDFHLELQGLPEKNPNNITCYKLGMGKWRRDCEPLLLYSYITFCHCFFTNRCRGGMDDAPVPLSRFRAFCRRTENGMRRLSLVVILWPCLTTTFVTRRHARNPPSKCLPSFFRS